MRSRFVSYVIGAAFVGLVPASAWAQSAGGNVTATPSPSTSVTVQPSPSSTQPPPLAPVDTYGDTNNQRAAGNASVGQVGSSGSASGTTTTTGTDVSPGAGASAGANVGPSGVGASAGVGAGSDTTATSPGTGAPAADGSSSSAQTGTSTTETNAPPPAAAQTTTVAPSSDPTLAPAAPVYNESTELRTGPAPAQEDLYSYGPRSGFGTALAIGGGVSNFVGSTAKSLTDVGGTWGANLTLGTRAPLALELGYIGGLNQLNVAGLDPNALLMRNGGQAALRLNGRVLAGWTMFEPFAFVGGAWQRFSITNSSFNTSSVRGTDDVYSVPFGGGVAMAYHGFYLEGRFTYRPTFDENFFGGADLTTWNAGLSLGAEF